MESGDENTSARPIGEANPYASPRIIRRETRPRDFRWVRKYLVALVPLLLGTCVGLVYFNRAAAATKQPLPAEVGDGVIVRRFKSLSPDRIENFGWIAIFGGGGTSALFCVYCVFLDWRAGDDRRQLDKALERER